MTKSVAKGEIRVGETVITFEMPSSLHEKLSQHGMQDVELNLYTDSAKTINSILRKFIEKGIRPPSYAQLNYAESISEKLDIEIPPIALELSRECSRFIENHKKAFETALEREKHLKYVRSQAARVDRWERAQTALQTDSQEDVAKHLGVTPPTIEKYCNLLEEWRLDAKEDGSYEVVMFLVGQIREGVNLWE